MAIDPNLRPRPKIAHLTSVHAPFDTRIFHKECKTLSEAGFEVVVVAQHDRDECADGVRVHAIPSCRNRWERMTRTIPAVLSAALAEQADLYHFHDPELIPVGLWLVARGKRVIYDVHEDVPRDILTKSWIAPWLKQPVSMGAALAESVSARLFDGIVTVTPDITERFPSNKSLTVQNYPVLGELDQGGATPYCERPAAAAYVGILTAGRAVREMVEALQHFPEESEMRLVLAGHFESAELKEELARKPGWSRVDYLGWLSRPEVAHQLNRVRAGLILFHPNPASVACQPIKLFEYMSAGLPVVACDVALVRKIVKETECGILVDPRDAKAIADAIKWLMEHPKEAEAMGRRGQEAVRTKLNWGSEAKKLLTFYEEILA